MVKNTTTKNKLIIQLEMYYKISCVKLNHNILKLIQKSLKRQKLNKESCLVNIYSVQFS